ncbi:MAG: hypothetical protein GF317_17085 [Candidatus Lokiarchaeota archaeon]|nr:hypothetical protein [Candidatus Lokiarchaeota archaeon]
MNMNQLKKVIIAERKRMYNHLIYIPLRRYGLKFIQGQTVSNVKLAFIMDRLGLPITINLFSFLSGKKRSNVYSTLQGLGDKNVLNLIGYQKNALVYQVHPTFLEGVKGIDYTRLDLIRKQLEKEGINGVE